MFDHTDYFQQQADEVSTRFGGLGSDSLPLLPRTLAEINTMAVLNDHRTA